MVWFKQNKKKPAGPVARPLTIERMCALFDKRNWSYQLDADNLSLATNFHGLPISIITTDDGLHFLASRSTDSLTADRFPEVLTWVEDFNDDNPSPTAMVFHTEDSMLHVAASFTIPNSWEYTDDQLKEWVRLGLDGIMDVSRDFDEAFSPEIDQRLHGGTGEVYPEVSQVRIDRTLSELGLSFERDEDGSTVLRFQELECSILANYTSFGCWALWRGAATSKEDIDHLRLVINEMNQTVPMLRAYPHKCGEGVRPQGFVLFLTDKGASDEQLKSMVDCFLQIAHFMASRLTEKVGHLSFPVPNYEVNESLLTWFTKDKNVPDGPGSRPVDIERVLTFFEERAWGYYFDEEDQIIHGEFDGIGVTIIPQPTLLKIVGSCESDKLPLERFPEALAWAEDFNESNRPFATVTALHDLENNQVCVSPLFTIPQQWDYTNSQLQEWIYAGFTGVLEATKDFYKHFDPERLEEIQSKIRKES